MGSRHYSLKSSQAKHFVAGQPRMIQPRIPETKGQVQPGRLGLPGYAYTLERGNLYTPNQTWFRMDTSIP